MGHGSCSITHIYVVCVRRRLKLGPSTVLSVGRACHLAKNRPMIWKIHSCQNAQKSTVILWSRWNSDLYSDWCHVDVEVTQHCSRNWESICELVETNRSPTSPLWDYGFEGFNVLR